MRVLKKENTQNEINRHQIFYQNTGYNTLDIDGLDASIIRFYYNDRHLERFNNYNDFDSFMNKIDKNNNFSFFIPLVGNIDLFSNNTDYFDYYINAEENNYKIYDLMYQKLIDYGFKIYSNKEEQK